ncbi:MAG: hypothetical protein EBZ47_02080 [Chlamydiae bacterium]|nr:hypothetical protein [Chlamydiota bacterium]
METHQELRSRVAALESKVDHLESELSYLNELLISCGFSEGIKTLTSTVEELLEEGMDAPMESKPRYPELP